MQSQSNPPSIIILVFLVGVVSLSIWTITNQSKPENATLAHLREAGSIKVVIYDSHHEHHRKPSAKCPDRHFIGYIPRIKGMKVILTVSQIAQSQGSDTVVREESKPWQWKKETEMRNGHVVIQPIGIKRLTPGTYRARLMVEKNGEKITVSAKSLLTIPDREKSTAPVGATT